MQGKLAFSFFYFYFCIVILFLINLFIMNKRILTTIAVVAAACQMGFAQQKVTGKTTLDTLKAIGYFDNTRTSQVRVIDESQMNKRDQLNNPLDAIRGRVAGLQVERNGSNALSAVRLRGTTSLTGGNDPLIIVDGVMGDLTLLQSVYPTDIQSFTILKDASETAQYGSRGAAGVIDIKTKRGEEGRLRVNYNGSVGLSFPYKRLKMLSADAYRSTVKEYGQFLNDYGQNNDFQKMIERTAMINQHNVAFAGGGKNSNYRVSLGYMDEQEVIKEIGNRSFMSNMNMTQIMWDGLLRIDFGMFASTQDDHSIFDEQKLFYSAATWNPTFPDHPNSSGAWDGNPGASQITNPNALLEQKNHTTSAHISTHAKLTFQILPSLKFSLFGAYTYDSDELMRYLPTSTAGGGEARRQTVRSEAMLNHAMLNFNNKWNQHALQASLLAEFQKDKRRGYGVTVTQFSNDIGGFDNLAGGAVRPWDGTTSFYEYPSMASFMGQAGYTFNERYSINTTLRADGSSKFGANNRWGYFPSISVGWDLGKEDFIKNLGLFDELKLNSGLGWAGNQGAIDSYTTLKLLQPNGTPAVGQMLITTFSELKNSNPDLKWEVSRTFNLGLSAQMLKTRLVFSANYYYTKVYDMLYPYTVSVPPFKYPKLVANMGSMEKRGLELSVGGTPIVAPDMLLTVNANLSFPKNKLLSLSGNYNGEEMLAPAMAAISSMNGAGFHGYNDVVFQAIGQPLGVFYMPHFTGFKVNADGSRAYEYGDPYIAGQATPKVLLGSNVSFRYKKFDITIQANGAFGHKIYNGTSLTYMDITSLPLYNVLEEAPQERIASRDITDYWLESGSYLNIDYITLGWQVPIPKNRILESMRLSLTVEDVATFTNYSGLTPIINSSTINGTLGLDDKRTYPLYRTWTLSFSLNF